jgi:small subunit ribosomal protein S4
MNFALSRSQARQIVRHNHVRVNGIKVNIPSYLVKAGDTVTLKGKDSFIKNVKETIELCRERQESAWITVDKSNLSGHIMRLPGKEDIAVPIQEQLIVELYSK